MRLIRLLKNDLAKESAQWVESGIIEQQQAEQICQQYGVDYHQAQVHSFGYRMLVGLGFLFIGLSLITLIGANWDDIPRAVRMGSLIGLTLLTQLFGWHKWRQGLQSSATGVFFLGNMFYGASIILIAQIYHLGEHMPDGIYWWAFGCLPLAMLTQSRILMLQTLLLSTVYLLLESSLGFYPLAFFPFAISLLWFLYRSPSSLIILFGSVFAIGYWVESSFGWLWSLSQNGIGSFYLGWHVEHVLVTAGLFVFIYGLSQKLATCQSVKAKDYAAALALWSLRFAIFSLLILSFEDPWQDMIEADWDNLASAAIFYLLAIVITLGLSWQNRKNRQTITFLILGLLVGILLLAPAIIDVDYYAQHLQIIDNLLLVVVGCGLIIRGIQSGTSHYFYFGVTTILITALLRYFDLIGDYIGGAVLFMVFAIILLAAAKFWKYHADKQLGNKTNHGGQAGGLNHE
ncbi:DUF2157 domain-containing protein [Pelagibaculum spongiae]|uniref:DUF2157 domain-containing protein n=1 Tax=Pelagibaculum spongiae TaxID=2080658 RepID=A0A2V1GSH6_9GAMM|nr:DUF2157 domain-containing protein [Pelagibaculum spongiae]PVZ68349.1 DUF2157 domain-containing protein [Pelagibaculum spongiae]